MQTTRVTASEFQQSFGALSDKARHEPVIITKHGRDSLVIMSAEEWERLKRPGPRAGLTAGLPEEWVEAVHNAKLPAASWFAELDRFASIPFMEEGRNQPEMPEPADLFE
jgi:prevent-host-death family protein